MSTGAVSPRRADARRNHERILTVTLDLLTASGEVSFNAIAKKAEVGVGTVYRHFPTPEALVLAVYKREVQHLVDVVPTLLDEHSPEQAFRAWTRHLARYMITKHGLAEALRNTAMSTEELFADTYKIMLSAVETLLDANAKAGTIRPDLNPSIVLRALGGLLYLKPGEDWQQETDRLTDLIWVGMRDCQC